MKFRLEICPDRDEEVVATVHEPNDLTEKIERLVREDAGETKLTVYSEERDMLCVLDEQDVECVFVSGGKTFVTDRDGKSYVSRLRLYALEEMLPACFIRIHKSALANQNCIDRFEVSFSGAVSVRFRSGNKEFVSRRCFAQIRRRLEKK